MNHSNSFMIQAVISILAVVLLFTSCEKNESADNNPALTNTDGKCLLLPPTVNIAPFGSDASATRSGEEAKPEEVRFNVGEELGNILTIENTPEADTPATRALASGTYFRMVIYKKSDWDSQTMTITEQRLCKIGSDSYYDTSGNQITAPVLLVAGSYKVFCYSYNSMYATIPELTGSSIEVFNQQDFLSTDEAADLTITTGNSQVSLPIITLKHRCCKITGTLATKYFSSYVSSTNLWITVNTSFYAHWDIVNGNMGNYISSGINTFSIDRDTHTGSGSVILLPMPEQIAKAKYKITFNSSSVPNIDVTDQPLSTAPTTFTPGSNHTFTVTAINAYVLSSEPATIGGATWATSNLNGDRTNEAQPWISGPWNGNTEPSTGDLNYSDDRNDYWRWSVSNVDRDDRIETIVLDTWSGPCTTGYRLPTKTELSDLATNKLTNKLVYINGEVKQTNYYGWLDRSGNRAPGAVFYNGGTNVIFLPATGYRLGSTLNYTDTQGCYWSGNGIKRTTVRSAYYLSIANNRNGEIPEAGGGVNYGYAIRCVKK